MTEPVRESKDDRTAQAVRIGLTIGILALSLALLSPFLSPILWAGVLCYTLNPAYKWVVRISGGRRALSALVMCAVLTVGIIVPLVHLSLVVAEDVTKTYRTLVVSLREGERPLLEGWRDYPLLSAPLDAVANLERLTGTNLRASLAENLAELGKMLVGQVTSLVTHALHALVQLAVVLLCAFYFFRDGDKLMEWLRSTNLIESERQQVLAKRFDDVVKGTVYGNTVIALLEGLVGGIAFWSVGLPSAVLWGTIMAVLAYLPLVGAGLVWMPAAAYLVWQGTYGKALVLIGFGMVIAVMDYLIRTIVVGGRSHLHTLLVFFSVLGGLQLFGLIGIVVGPMVVAVGITVVEMWKMELERGKPQEAGDG
ncbi:MAG: AI-2E family transporter [Nitrospira sp.]|nr:AI-2E family transporter [Nitrospira sp.]